MIVKRLLPILLIFLLNNLWAEENPSKDCFRVQDISGWHALDDKRLIVWSPTHSKPFLVTLMNRCPNLIFEQSLVFKSTFSRTCSNSRDTIYAENLPCHIKSIQRIDKQKADILVSAKKAIVIDVRSLEEWQEGHLANAKHIEWINLESKIGEVSSYKKQTIFLYCQSGNRSEKALEILKNLGYIKVINLGGLLDAQELLGVEVVKS
jgi:phage shock protein E